LKKPLAFLNLVLQLVRIDGAFVNVKKRDVVVIDLVQQDDEFHKIGIGLLPEWLFAAPEEVIQETGDAIGKCVCLRSLCSGL
jgi:hypothetical protein